MTSIYADPDGGTVEEVITWEIEQGFQGKWSRCKTFADHAEAVAWLERRHTACSMENLRLVRVETSIVRSIEMQIEGDRGGTRQT